MATHTAASSCLSLSVCVCAKERDRQSQCAFSVVALGPAPLRPRPCACIVPGTVPGHAQCVCLGACVCAQVGVCLPVRQCAANLSLLPMCACARVCACVSDSLLSLGMGAGLSLSLPHTLIHAACGGAGGGVESQLGRLEQQQQRVHCVGDKGPLGALWMRRLRHAWGGHSEREREARVAASGGVLCVSAMATKFNNAQQICQTKLQNNNTLLKYGPPLPPSRLWGECGLSMGEYVYVCMCA
jgi:hypothetical protein